MRRHAVILAAALAWLVGSESAEAKLDILVDKATQRMLVIQDGYIRYMWPVSTGRDELATPNGVYAPQRLERNWFSTAYYNSPMPYSIFFHNGYAIHGSYAIDKLGGPASHGCVRLHPHHAAVLFDLVQQEGPANTTIEITDDPRPDQPALPGRGIPALSGREIAAPSLAGRQVAAAHSQYPLPPGIIRYHEPPDMPELPGREIPALSGREIAAPSLAGRQVAAAQSPYPPPPRIVRYRDLPDMPELSPAPRDSRSIVARNTLPPRLAPVGRRIATNVRPAGTVGRASAAAAGQVEAANAAPRPSGEASDAPAKVDSPAKAKSVEGAPAQPAQSIYGFKLLPTSCWSGGASRWRWWSSGQEAPCK
jgi:L,D-transpeptidase catalytic domain